MADRPEIAKKTSKNADTATPVESSGGIEIPTIHLII